MPLIPIYYDTETTGISAANDKIIEIAAYDPVNDREFVSFVNPGRPIPPEATAVHHITDEMVAQAPSWDLVGQDFIDFCKGDTVLIAHNNDNFDIHFLREEYKRFNMEMPEWKFIDTLKWARKYRPDLPRHSLQVLRETFGIEANNAHRALDDVKMMHEVFTKMIDDLDMDTIYELMQKASQKEDDNPVMPFGKHKGKPLDQVPTSYLSWLFDQGAFDKPENEKLRGQLDKLGKLPKPELVG